MWTKTFRAIILSALTLLSAPFASAQESSLQVQLKEVEMLAESLREENRVLRQNVSAAARAPVKGVSGGGAARGRSSDFERGFESVEW